MLSLSVVNVIIGEGVNGWVYQDKLTGSSRILRRNSLISHNKLFRLYLYFFLLDILCV